MNRGLRIYSDRKTSMSGIRSGRLLRYRLIGQRNPSSPYSNLPPSNRGRTHGQQRMVRWHSDMMRGVVGTAQAKMKIDIPDTRSIATGDFFPNS